MRETECQPGDSDVDAESSNDEGQLEVGIADTTQNVWRWNQAFQTDQWEENRNDSSAFVFCPVCLVGR